MKIFLRDFIEIFLLNLAEFLKQNGKIVLLG